jgi:hypothetical protein
LSDKGACERSGYSSRHANQQHQAPASDAATLGLQLCRNQRNLWQRRIELGQLVESGASLGKTTKEDRGSCGANAQLYSPVPDAFLE